jgi:hypothetical protein
MKAKATYLVKKWEENPYQQISSQMKMTKASVEYAMSGEISGTVLTEYLMFYKYFDDKDQHKSSASYVGLMRFVGSMQGKEGSFVIQDNGAFDNGNAISTLHIMAGSGMGSFEGIQGSGRYFADQNGAQFELDYNL